MIRPYKTTCSFGKYYGNLTNNTSASHGVKRFTPSRSTNVTLTHSIDALLPARETAKSWDRYAQTTSITISLVLKDWRWSTKIATLLMR